MFPSPRWLELIAGDLRLTVRALARAPGFSLITVLLLAIGIGATTTLFSLAYGVLLKPLAWPDAGRLVRLQETRGGAPGRIPWTITNTTYHAWTEESATIAALGGWTRARPALMTVGANAPERVRVLAATPGLFRALDVGPLAGRWLDERDAAGPGAPGAIVIGYRLWQRRFGGRLDAIGTTLRLEGSAATVVGVMPRDFAFPDRETDAWSLLNVARVDPGANTISGMIFNAMARLRPGTTAEQASAEGTARGRAAPSLGGAGLALFGNGGEIALRAAPLQDALTADVRPPLLMLLAAVGLLFATAIASVVVLQSARAVKRRREMAVRAAIGAGGGRLTMFWVLESVVLGVVGGGAGLVVAAAFHRLLPIVLPADFPRVDDVALNLRVAMFAIGLALAAGVVCGLVPAWQSHLRSLTAPLRSDGFAWRAGGTRARGVRLRALMMAGQVAAACLLLVSAGLLARSVSALVAADRGFDPHNVLTAHGTTEGRPFAAQAPALERAQDRIRALPGVTHVAIGNALPFITFGGMSSTALPSPTSPGTTVPAQTLTRIVSPEYFDAMGLRLMAGRALARTDTATSRPAVVVNRTFAAQYLGPTPVGTVLPVGFGSRKDWEVVGVVEDLRQSGLRGVQLPFGGLTDPAQPEMFFTYRQWDSNVSEIVYVVRSTSDPAALAPAVRTVLREEAPTLLVESVLTMEDRLMDSLARPRTYAMLVAGFAFFAAAVALVGLFGVLSHMAAQRTREIGVRSALGARPRDILGLVTREAAGITIAGLACGLAGAWVFSRTLSTLLYGVGTHDALTYVAVPVGLLVAAAAACALPAARAARVSPVVALRTE